MALPFFHSQIKKGFASCGFILLLSITLVNLGRGSGSPGGGYLSSDGGCTLQENSFTSVDNLIIASARRGWPRSTEHHPPWVLELGALLE
jgi:hypothetical protein